MKTCCVKNGLGVVVILLFIGVAVQPVIAVNPISSDNEEDCSVCPKVSKQQELGKYQELFDRITTLGEMNQGLKSDREHPIICNILLLYVYFQFVKIELYKILPDTVQILFMPLFIKNALLTVSVFMLYWIQFDCEEFELPYW